MKSEKKLGGLSKEEILKFRKSDLQLKCIKCNKELPFKEFSYGLCKLNGLYYVGYECNKCGYKRKLIRHGHKTQEYNATQIYKQRHTIEGRASYLLYGVKRRVKVYNHTFNISKEFIINKLKKGVCEATGIKLDLDGILYKPYAPSLDRIDSSKGYTEDNVQMVCMIYNFCKNKFSDEEVIKFLKDANS